MESLPLLCFSLPLVISMHLPTTLLQNIVLGQHLGAEVLWQGYQAQEHTKITSLWVHSLNLGGLHLPELCLGQPPENSRPRYFAAKKSNKALNQGIVPERCNSWCPFNSSAFASCSLQLIYNLYICGLWKWMEKLLWLLWAESYQSVVKNWCMKWTLAHGIL